MIDLTNETVILTSLFIFGQAFAGYIFLRPFPSWLTWLETLLIVAAPGVGILILAQRYPTSTSEQFYRYIVFPALLTTGPVVASQVVKYIFDARLANQRRQQFTKSFNQIEEETHHAK